jgi:hypothetical protein
VPGLAKGEGIMEGLLSDDEGEGMLCMLDALA